MKIKPFLLFTVAALLIFSLGQTVWAFSDTKGDPNEKKIEALQQQGIIKGNNNGKFNAKGKLTYAAGISMIVKGFDLNIDHIRFVKEPKVTDHFKNLKDDAWYSQAFINAQYNDIDIPVTVKADDEMTREQFAHHLFKAVSKKGDFAFIELFLLLNDEADVNSDYMDSVQKILISKIASLDTKNNFYPKAAITRGDTAAWLHDGIQFVKDTPPIVETTQPNLDLTLAVAPVNAEVNKVTISGQVPHPGYGFHIASISFEGDQAIINIETSSPDPDKMYPQVITDVSAVTYVDAKFKPVLASSGDAISSGTSSSVAGSGPIGVQ